MFFIFPVSFFYIYIFLKRDHTRTFARKKSQLVLPLEKATWFGWLVGLGFVWHLAGHINARSVQAGSPL